MLDHILLISYLSVIAVCTYPHGIDIQYHIVISSVHSLSRLPFFALSFRFQNIRPDGNIEFY